MMLNLMRFIPDLESKHEFSKGQAEGIVKTVGEVMENFLTKSDLKEHDLANRNDFNLVRSDISMLFKDMKSMEEGIRKDMKSMEEGIRKDMKSMEEGIRKDMKSMEEGIRKDMGIMGDKITMRLTAAMVVLFGSLLAAQKLLFY
jgi:hypothetical protein